MSGSAFFISLVVLVQCVHGATVAQQLTLGPDLAPSRIPRLKDVFLEKRKLGTVASYSLPAGALLIYGGGALNSAWNDESWGATNNYLSTSYLFYGTSSLESTLTSYGGLQLRTSGSFTTAQYQGLAFWIYTTAAVSLTVEFNSGAISLNNFAPGGSIPTGSWTQITVPFLSVSPTLTSSTQLNGFQIQNTASATVSIWLSAVILYSPSSATGSSSTAPASSPASSPASRSSSSSSSSHVASSSSHVASSSSHVASSSSQVASSSSHVASSSSGVAGVSSSTGSTSLPRFKGVNLSGGEFGCSPSGCPLPASGDANTLQGYYFPTTNVAAPNINNGGDVAYFAGLGMNIIRLQTTWERLIPSTSGFPVPGSSFASTYLSQVDTIINYATSQNVYVLFDVHNYATYNSVVIGTSASVASFADLWSQLANHYKANPKVVFGLMNEPHNIDTVVWFGAAQAAITAIRQAGATNLIVVPGVGYTGGHDYTTGGYDHSGIPNSQALTQTPLVDSANNFILDIHQYLDSDFSGTGTCVSPPTGTTSLTAFTNWAAAAGYKAILSEVGGDTSSACAAAVQNILGYLNSNTNVWVGFTWWVAGSAYIEWNAVGQEYLLEPTGTQAAGILSYLQPLLPSFTGSWT